MQSIFGAEVGMSIRGCRFKLGHYCFMDVGWGTEREELIGHSRANYEEALVVCNVVEGVVKGLLPGLKPNVGVITLQKWSRAWGSLIDDARNRGCYQVLTNRNKNQNIPPRYAASLNQGFFFFIST